VVVAVGCHSSSAPKSPPGAEGAWYDAAPLLASLRPEQRADAARAAGVQHLEDLPLYDLDLDVDLAAPRYTLEERLWFTNLESAPLSEIVLRLYPNETRKAASEPEPPVRLVSGACEGGATCTVAMDGPSAISVRPSKPVPAGGRLRIKVVLSGRLEVIDKSRTNLMAQGLEGLASLGSTEGGGDYGLLAVGDGIASLASFYAPLARRKDGVWERIDKTTMGDLGPDDLCNVRATVRLPAGAKIAATGVVTSEEATTNDAGLPRRRVHIAAGMVREFALLASEEAETQNRVVNGVTVTSFYLPGDKAAGT